MDILERHSMILIAHALKHITAMKEHEQYSEELRVIYGMPDSKLKPEYYERINIYQKSFVQQWGINGEQNIKFLLRLYREYDAHIHREYPSSFN